MATTAELQQRIGDLETLVAQLRRDMVPQPVRRPVGGGGGGNVRYGVVRDIGDGTDDFVMVQMLSQITASPGWEFPEVASVQVAAVEVACYAGVSSSEYALFLSSASGEWSAGFDARIIRIERSTLSWVAIPWCPMELVDPADLTTVLQTDAFPPQPT